MAKINRSEIINHQIKLLDIQTMVDRAPNELAEKILPTVVLNNFPIEKVYVNTAVNVTSTTVVPSEQPLKNFYIVGVSLSMIKDATSTSTESYIEATISGETRKILSIVGLTLTAQNQTQSLIFNHPIKCDKDTTILVKNETNVASIRSRAVIYGYYA